MPITIGSNIGSLKAQRRLADATSSLSSTYERLASGQRINKASDDAAGLAIASDLRAKARIYTKGISNGNDGYSLLSVADSALENLTDVVTRIRELSEQSANGTYSAKQRGALDNEAQALSKEFKRIVQATSFNGISIFNGSLGSGLRLQMGVGLAQSLNSTIGGAIGTGSFGGPTSYVTEDGPSFGSRSVTLGDVNGDGVLDMITAGGYGQAQITVQIGRGDGTFGQRTTYATLSGSGGQGSSVTLGDLNGDGVLDIVTAGGTAGGGQTAVLLGRGDGTFRSSVTYAATSSTQGSVSLGDLNGDGILDMLSVGGGQASVRLGRGDGTFGNQAAVSTGITSASGALGDINGDGILDLITVGRVGASGRASVQLGRGDGTFGTSVTYSTGSTSFSPVGVTLGDLNGDGFLDLVTSSDVGTGRAAVFLGRGNGTFGTLVTYATGVGTTTSVTLGDLNGDGILDIVTAGYSGGGIATVLRGNGDGTFGNRATFAADPTKSFAVTLGDLNGDGVLDLVTAGYEFNGYYTPTSSVFLATTQDGRAPLLDFSLKTKADALQAMGMLDRMLTNLAKQRGTIGASQTRVTTAISNLQTARENFTAAESRIKDADIASDSANLTRTQILQQAGAAVLAQSNLTPQLALKLLS